MESKQFHKRKLESSAFSLALTRANYIAKASVGVGLGVSALKLACKYDSPAAAAGAGGILDMQEHWGSCVCSGQSTVYML